MDGSFSYPISRNLLLQFTAALNILVHVSRCTWELHWHVNLVTKLLYYSNCGIHTDDNKE